MESSVSKPRVAIDIHHLQFAYDKNGAIVLAIDNWQVLQGEHVFLSGPSGSGKSTLLNLLCGTLTPTSGTISLLGQPFSALTNRQRDKFRASNIGVVFQQFNLIPYLSVLQNIQAAVYFAPSTHLDSLAVVQKAKDLLTKLQLPLRILHTKADALSIGQQQRVAIARALINDPKLLIVDEPTSALDADARDNFMSLLKEVAGKSTMIFVSHDLSLSHYFDCHCKISELTHSPVTHQTHSCVSENKHTQENA
ncbi:ABC transporter ATP-binding protein [Alteromonas sp. D210916BOD_24]|uniref:ABC transporter ATP-binding protein n=1 Tax=Alteromonas sp. D210916BOD_24 TaxID=3157618 RepID=UPI00399C6449